MQKREAEQYVDSIVILSFISKNYQEVDTHTHTDTHTYAHSPWGVRQCVG